MADDEEDGDGLPADVLETLTEHAALDSRRLRFDLGELITLVGESLVRRGMDKELLQETRWLWVSRDGAPELFLIFPGAEA